MKTSPVRWLIGYLVVPLLALQTAWADDRQLAELFQQQQVDGTIVIVDLAGTQKYIHNSERAAKRLWPASTFKVPNTLMALDAGVIASADSVIKWDGQDKGLKMWNQDQTLATALSRSCVWCYQGFARQIGNQAYLDYLQQIDYGNGLTGKQVDTFWLEGDLAISALEQVDFLARLYQQQLPFKAEHFAVLKQIMLVEKAANYQLYAKTGWAQRGDVDHGWYVGYVERGEAVWLFALNIDIKSRNDANKRILLTRQALAVKGIIDTP
ncbi:class D beta-lactamase [Neiella marina]|uniref:Beta-lactamase n=1 Tax=Neiella holothuriorum TaxID=2870530 RepID=A0ABS7ELS6_9GAMM|nr:class D beta-lactamase [Neiella holothuriorum]MBW8192637.1 class D beta-lactamase [Neiella holothuriorum]